MLPKASMKLALGAGAAGLLLGYLAHRKDDRAPAFALLQAFEWFLSAGGASLVADALRDALEDEQDLEITERVIRMQQAVVDRMPGQ